MTVKEVMAILATMPPDAPMGCLWDGGMHSTIDGVYLAKSGYVIVGSSDKPAYSDEDRPENAPTSEQDPYWRPIETDL